MTTQITVDLDAYDVAMAAAADAVFGAEALCELGRQLAEPPADQDVLATWTSIVSAQLDQRGKALVGALAAKLGGA